MGAMTTVLAADRLTVGYGTIPVVREVDLDVHAGQVVALLGPNGAGKTTTLLGLVGELVPSSGVVRWNGQAVTTRLHARARSGLAYVADDRSVIMDLTVRENLRVGRCAVADALAYLPELEPHLDRRAGLLSGGQQQMLALARALGRRPKALVADEMSLGLAPRVVERLLTAVRSAADAGVAVLLVEQHIRTALEIADHVYLLRRGRIEWSGTAAEARARRAAIEDSYLTGGRA
jgi:branched-chain amino acid transport system ATP-binding protein